MISKALMGALLAVVLSTGPAASASDLALDTVLAGFDHDEHPDLRGVVVMRDGSIVAERYYNGEPVRADGLHDGRRIVSAAWLQAVLTPKVGISDSDPYADGYGYFWYHKTQQIGGKPVPVSFASGNGGNKIYVVASRRLVVAITSAAHGHGYGQRRSEAILKAVLSRE